MPGTIDRASRTIHNPLFRDTATFLETSLETGGDRTVAEIEIFPGGGPPLHLHRAYTETFEPLTGPLGVHRAGRELLLQPGERATVEIGQPHRFYNDGADPVRFRVTLSPGHTGFEQALMILYGMAVDGLVNSKGLPKDPDAHGYVVMLGDSRLTGLQGSLGPLFAFFNRRARRRGKNAELTARYVLDCSNPAVAGPDATPPADTAATVGTG